MKKELTQERLKELLSYDPETGVFRWVLHRRSNLVGSVAGCIGSWGYRIIRIEGKGYRAARLAWLHEKGEWPKNTMDHISGDKLDDRFLNLREATISENNLNRRVPRVNTSGYRGAYFHRPAKRWYVQIHVNNKPVHIGFFDTAKEAGEAFKMRASELYGEFRRND